MVRAAGGAAYSGGPGQAPSADGEPAGLMPGDVVVVKPRDRADRDPRLVPLRDSLAGRVLRGSGDISYHLRECIGAVRTGDEVGHAVQAIASGKCRVALITLLDAETAEISSILDQILRGNLAPEGCE